jgi:type II secretory pathway pseudopilin PulG
MSLPEVMVVLLVMGVLAFTSLSIVQMSTSTVSETETRAWLEQWQRELVGAFKNKASWNNIVSANPSLACLRNKSDCNGAGGPVSQILNSQGQPIWDSQAATTGFGRHGELCNGFASKGCPYRYEVTWRALCHESPCMNAQVEITGTLKYAGSGTPSDNFDPSKYSFKLFVREYQNMTSETCASIGGSGSDTCVVSVAQCPGGTYLHGFQPNGDLICEPVPEIRCPAGQVLVGITASGDIECSWLPGC